MNRLLNPVKNEMLGYAQQASYGNRMKMLAHMHSELDERISSRGRLGARIDLLKQDGHIKVEESGRDCDCVEYSGRIHTCPATIAGFMKLRDDIGEWADGPFHLTIVSFKEAGEAQYESRDLVLEAFEDGHPHHIVSRF